MKAKSGGALFIIGLGPGPECWLVPEASDVLAQADALIGYKPYTDRVPERAGLERFPTDNRVEIVARDPCAGTGAGWPQGRGGFGRRRRRVRHGGGGFRGDGGRRSRLARAWTSASFPASAP